MQKKFEAHDLSITTYRGADKLTRTGLQVPFLGHLEPLCQKTYEVFCAD
jgi:hypothetical protein